MDRLLYFCASDNSDLEKLMIFKLSWADVSGVTQGAVLCPLLFFLHINDIISDIVI